MKTEEQLKAQFRRAVTQLRAVVVAAKERWPDAQLYLASGTLNLMKGDHHDHHSANARPDNVVEGIIFKEMDGGDW